jgi:hypothetical protein
MSFVRTDLLIHFFDVFSSERWSIDEESVEGDTDWPGVNVSISKLCPFAVSNNTSGAACLRRSSSARRGSRRGRETKVADFDVDVRVKESISKFEVAAG